MFRIATWNVNSLRVRLPHVLSWVREHRPHILALQETKLLDISELLIDIQAAGYQAIHSGQKSYNGVAVLSTLPMTDVMTNFPNYLDPARRILGVSLNDIRILNLYVPNGQSIDSDKYAYKLLWLSKLRELLEQELKTYSKIILLGDFNIAPAIEDVHDLDYQGILVSPAEREALQMITQLGFKDCFRIHPQPERSYSWWDYRLNAFKRNRGFRIDHIFATSSLITNCARCFIDKGPRGFQRPSDHAPVIADFSLSF